MGLVAWFKSIYLSIFQVDLHCALRRVATSSCRGHVDELATELFLLLHCEHRTDYADGAETTAIDGLVSSWSENISVSFCLRTPGYGLTLWCALGLLVGSAIQVPQLQLPLSVMPGCNCSANISRIAKFHNLSGSFWCICTVSLYLWQPPGQMSSRRAAHTASYDHVQLYRPVHELDTVAFSRDILSSRLYDFTVADVDEYCLTMK